MFYWSLIGNWLKGSGSSNNDKYIHLGKLISFNAYTQIYMSNKIIDGLPDIINL